jgi:hypothetical protein
MSPPIRQQRSYPEAIDPVLIAREAGGWRRGERAAPVFPRAPVLVNQADEVIQTRHVQ